MTTAELSKVESIAEQLYGPSPSQEITQYCEQMKNFYLSNLNSFQDLFNSYIKTANSHFAFWLLDILITLTNTQYNNLSPQLKENFRNYLTQIILNQTNPIHNVLFIMNKFCFLVITWLKFDYPENNSNFWNDILKNIYETNDANVKLTKLNIILDLLITFDDELIKFRHTYTDFEGIRSTLIKDHMRVNVMKSINAVLYQIVSNEEYIEHKIISKTIKVVAQLIDWNPLEYFNDILNVILTKLISKPKYINECLEVLNSIIKKGMEPNLKIDLLKKLNVNGVIESTLKNQNISIQALENSAEIINNIGNFLIESYETVKDILIHINTSNVSQQECNAMMSYTNDELNFCFYFTIELFKHKKFEYKTGNQVIDYLSNVISYLKNNDLILTQNQTLTNTLQSLFNQIESLLKIPSEYYSLEDDLSKCEEDDYFTFRKELSILYHNIYGIKSMSNYVLDSVINKKGTNNLYEVEHILFLISTIQQGFKNEDFKNQIISPKINQIFSLLFTIPFHEANSSFILLSYYETICKILNHLLQNQQALEHILNVFMGKRGILIENTELGVKIIGYFDRFLSKTKNQLMKLSSIQQAALVIKVSLQNVVNSNNFLLISQYQLLFHCLSLIIFLDSNAETKKANYEDSLKLFISLFNNKNIDIDKFVEILKCLTQFLKCYNSEISNEQIKSLFINFFDVFISNYCSSILSSKSQKALYAMITILQRILILLNKDSLKYMEFFFSAQNSFITVEVYEDALRLLQNVINVVKKNSISFTQSHFAFFYNSIRNVPLPSDNISDYNKNVLSMYLNFIKLTNTICVEIPEAFFNDKGLINIDINSLFDFFIITARDIIDNNLTRTILRMIKIFCVFLNKNSASLMNNSSIVNLIVMLLNGTFVVMKRLNLSEPIDSSSFCEITHIHFYCSIFTKGYSDFLLSFMTQEQAKAFYDLVTKINVKQIKVSDELSQAFKFIIQNKLK